jgi:hypothetical protein
VYRHWFIALLALPLVMAMPDRAPAADYAYGYFSGTRYADAYGPYYRIGRSDYRYRVDGYGVYYYRAGGTPHCSRGHGRRSCANYGLPRTPAQYFAAYYYNSRGGIGRGYWTSGYTTDGRMHRYLD